MKTKVWKIVTKIFYIILVVAAVSVIIATILRNNSKCSDIFAKDSLNQEESDTLISVQVVFRHGIRTPDRGAFFPNDIYINHSFYPENFGELTNKGRKYSYLLGKSLRERYDTFLADDFYPGMVKSFTSGYDRTHMTLQCVHAGLFPRRNSVIGISWRPVTFESFDFEDDTTIAVMVNCKILPLPTIKPTDNETIELFKYLSEKAGIKIETYFGVVNISNTFEVEEANGLELPDWGKPLYPEPLVSLDNFAWKQWVRAHLRFAASGLLQTITQNALNAIASLKDHNSEDVMPKIILFSGHDYNLQLMIYALGIRNMTTTFNAHIIFELHKINEIYGFKVFYNNFRDGKLIPMQLPYCINATKVEIFCPLNSLIRNTKWIYDPPSSCSA